MAWYNNIFGRKPVEEKLNPAQQYMGKDIDSSREPTFSYELAYEDLEIVNRGVNMIVDDVSEISLRVGNPTKARSIIKKIKPN